MTIDMGPIRSRSYSHDLLLHDNDQDLVAGTLAFVDQGLSSGGQVLVHGTKNRVAMMRHVLGEHPRLQYALEEELFVSPSRTLFAYERQLAESPEPVELWGTGTVPFGTDPAGHPGWARYESMVNEVLAGYAFHSLCTYDTRNLPARAIAAARATHPSVIVGGERVSSPDYLSPAAFLEDPLARVPRPAAPPTIAAIFSSLNELGRARTLVASCSEAASAVARDTIEDLVIAVHEVLLNALTHGAPPVQLTVWAEVTRVTCRIVDAGAGIHDTLAGFPPPDGGGPAGLWLARQVCEDIVFSNRAGGGCQVMMATG